MKIKRLIAGGITAVIGATIIAGGALAATTFDKGMGEFVTVSGGTLTSPVIVVGAGVDTTDVLGAADIAASLVSNYAIEIKQIPSTGAATGVTGGVLIDSDLKKTYLGAPGNLSAAKSVITETDLPDLLVKSTFTDSNSTTSTVTQKIVPNTAVYATFGVPSGETDPILYMPISMSTTPYNLTVTFIGGLDPSAVDTTYGMKLFGKDYTFGNTHDINTLEMYSSVGAQVLDLSGAGDEKTVDVGGTSFTIKLNGWYAGTVDKAYIVVNGVSYTWNEAGTYTVGGVKFYVQSIDVIQTGGTDSTGMVKLFVGTDKLKLENGAAIEKNDVTKNTYVYFTNTTTKINSITFQVYPDDDVAVAEGVPFVDPVFGSFKTVLGGMTPSITDSSRDLIKLLSDSSNVKLSFKNQDGMQYTNIPVFYGASGLMSKYVNSAYKFWTQECNTTGAVTANNITKGDYFVASSGDYSYILKYASYSYDNSDSSKTYVTLTDLSSNQNYKVYPSSEDLMIGSTSFDVQIYGDKTLCVSLDGGSTYNLAQVNITTEGGAKIDLTHVGAAYIDEVPLYSLTGGNDPTATKFWVNATHSTTSGVKFTVTPDPTQVGTANEWKSISNYGSYVYVSGDNNGKNSVSLYAPYQRPAPANIAIGTNPVLSTSAGAAGGTYNAAVPVTNPIAKFPSEVTQTAALDKDLILVGGPCANALVKTLLDTAWSSTDSCAAWLADADLKDNGKGLIQVVENIFGSGKKALIVAGTSAQDTRNLIANKAIKPTEFKALGAVAQYKGAA
ncbi:MAG: S-layer protein [Candidatus Aenigmarchaeota archaeon]|nr:S-layer protein [Candidatus Aenigmarchaeota archaeon]